MSYNSRSRTGEDWEREGGACSSMASTPTSRSLDDLRHHGLVGHLLLGRRRRDVRGAHELRDLAREGRGVGDVVAARQGGHVEQEVRGVARLGRLQVARLQRHDHGRLGVQLQRRRRGPEAPKVVLLRDGLGRHVAPHRRRHAVRALGQSRGRVHELLGELDGRDLGPEALLEPGRQVVEVRLLDVVGVVLEHVGEVVLERVHEALAVELAHGLADDLVEGLRQK
mmetsp:Transcript_21354/g.63823  ORF Transcript_21354/g.63823 Transcript_21354/m.63823 type:complete len:225 (-) Transcript_21354:1641-2315(-)